MISNNLAVVHPLILRSLNIIDFIEFIYHIIKKIVENLKIIIGNKNLFQ